MRRRKEKRKRPPSSDGGPRVMRWSAFQVAGRARVSRAPVGVAGKIRERERKAGAHETDDVVRGLREGMVSGAPRVKSAPDIASWVVSCARACATAQLATLAPRSSSAGRPACSGKAADESALRARIHYVSRC